MKKNLSLIAALSLLTVASCQTSKINDENQRTDDFQIQDQIVNETVYETINDEAQAEQLNQETIEKEIITVETIEVKDRVFFGYDSAKISDEAAQILDTQAEWLESNPELNITIQGHCDTRGTREYNIALGEKRANAAKNYLVNKGINSSRLKTISYGKERPAYFGTSAEIHAKNRRAVVITQD